MRENVTDIRQQALCRWFCQQVDLDHATLTTVSADASFRRYFRYTCQSVSYILVDAPPQTEKNQEFIDYSLTYAEQGIDVPHVLFYDLEQGFMCLTDLGSQTLLPLLIKGQHHWYQQAVKQLDLIANVSSCEPVMHYDADFFTLELGLFEQWFCQDLLGLSPEVFEQTAIAQCFDLLISSAIAQPQITTHRDFHSRNLMVRDGLSLAVIDFQDTVIGPLTYDLASLLKDCYFRLSTSQRDEFIHQAYKQFSQSQSLSCDYAQFRQWFDFMGLQRHLKVCGIFSRLSLRDHKHHYLEDLPLVVEYIVETCNAYSQLQPLSAVFEQTIIPALIDRELLCTR